MEEINRPTIKEIVTGENFHHFTSKEIDDVIFCNKLSIEIAQIINTMVPLKITGIPTYEIRKNNEGIVFNFSDKSFITLNLNDKQNLIKGTLNSVEDVGTALYDVFKKLIERGVLKETA